MNEITKIVSGKEHVFQKNFNEIVVWVGLDGEPYEYRIVYCPGRSPVIHRVIHGEPDD